MSSDDELQVSKRSVSLPAHQDSVLEPLPSQFNAILARSRNLRVHLSILTALLVIGLGALLVRHEVPKSGSATGASPLRTATQPLLIEAPFAPAALRRLTAAEAIAWNARVPALTQFGPSALPFGASHLPEADLQRSLQCLTMAVYYEAGNEPLDGERAVAQVVLNRVRHIAYPNSVCGVVFEGAKRRTGCQFSFACDGSMARLPAPASWRRANDVAAAALGGFVYAPVGLATHYHASYIVPYWASSLQKIAVIGAHIFYRMNGAWGRRAAFAQAYTGDEPGLPILLAPLNSAVALPESRVEVTAADRPVLVLGSPGGKDSAETVPRDAGSNAPPPKVVTTRERWIMPHLQNGVEPFIALATSRSVIIEPRTASRSSDTKNSVIPNGP